MQSSAYCVPYEYHPLTSNDITFEFSKNEASCRSFLLLHITCRISALLQSRGGTRGNGRRPIFCSEYDQKGAAKANASCCCSAVKKLHTASTDSLIGENIWNMHTFCRGSGERGGNNGDGEKERENVPFHSLWTVSWPHFPQWGNTNVQTGGSVPLFLGSSIIQACSQPTVLHTQLCQASWASADSHEQPTV